MMDCERYGANVFDVIELINRDYPRGGMAAPGLHRGHLPAQGLRVLRGALERARDAAGRLARARDRAAVPRRRRQAPARRVAARAPRRRARAGVQARHRRRARLAVAQADPAARARAGRRRRSTIPSSPRPPRASRRPSPAPTWSIVATNHSEYSTPEALRAIAELAGPDCLRRRPVERARHRPGVRLRRRGGGAAGMSQRGVGGVRRDVASIWGLPYLFIKVAVDDGVSPAFLSFARVPIAAVVLLGLRLAGRARWRRCAGSWQLGRRLRGGRDRAAVPADRGRRAARVLVAGGDPDRLRAAAGGADRDPLRRGRAGDRASGWSGCWSGSAGVVALVGIDVAGNDRRADRHRR